MRRTYGRREWEKSVPVVPPAEKPILSAAGRPGKLVNQGPGLSRNETNAEQHMKYLERRRPYNREMQRIRRAMKTVAWG